MSDVFVRFASLGHSQMYAYAFDSDAWKRDNGGIEAKFRMYQTYGHGLTAHSPDWSITHDFLGDYLASLAHYMLENRPASLTDSSDLNETEKSHRELFQRVARIVLDRPRQELIDFAGSIAWKESDDQWGKERYYSLTEKKITKNREKQHDKRYKRVERSDDGSPEAILRMIVPEHSDGLERYCYAVAVKEWCDSQPSKWCETAAHLVGWWREDEDSHNKKAILRYGFEAIRAVARMYESEIGARNHLENYFHNHLKRQQLALPAETEAA